MVLIELRNGLTDRDFSFTFRVSRRRNRVWLWLNWVQAYS